MMRSPAAGASLFLSLPADAGPAARPSGRDGPDCRAVAGTAARRGVLPDHALRFRQGRREAEGTAGECSADINVLASLLVLLAALLRLGELLREPKNVPADHGGDVCQSFLCGLYSPVA